MRKIVFAVVIASALGMSSFAQSPQQSALHIEADSIQQLIPVQDIGVMKEGPANLPLTVSGNVVIVSDGYRITADSAVWHRRENRIELNGGSAQIELARRPTSFSLTDRP